MPEWPPSTIPNLTVLALGAAGHHAPEDAPQEIARAIGGWLDQVVAPGGSTTPSR